jgi:aspartyl-tRNA(Asn)/glutamyl-tRNA(Gln) amidotransferase subunit B
MLPDQLLTMLTTETSHGLTMKDAKTLVSQDDGVRLDYYMDVLDHLQTGMDNGDSDKLGAKVSNW